jgi:hypothetical protein
MVKITSDKRAPLIFPFFLFLDEKKQKSRAAEKKAKNLSSRVK